MSKIKYENWIAYFMKETHENWTKFNDFIYSSIAYRNSYRFELGRFIE